MNNLAVLEKELQNIKSARMLVEDTITSYRDTQKEIAKLLEGLCDVNASMIAIVEGFKSQNKTISDRLWQAIEKVNADLADIAKSFQVQCDKSNTYFSQGINNSINDMRQKMSIITDKFSANNKSLKKHIDSFCILEESIANANADVGEIKEKTAELQVRFDEHFKNLTQSIESIGKECGDIGSLLNEIDKRQMATEERLQKLASFISDDSAIRKSNYETLQKSVKNINPYLIITLILLIFSICYPFFREFIKI